MSCWELACVAGGIWGASAYSRELHAFVFAGGSREGTGEDSS